MLTLDIMTAYTNKRESNMKVLKESTQYKLLETKEIEWVGNYQIVNKIKLEGAYIFDDYKEALNKFNKLNQE
jgi:hypothetical protein